MCQLISQTISLCDCMHHQEGIKNENQVLQDNGKNKQSINIAIVTNFITSLSIMDEITQQTDQ